ncbi:MAG: enoyl-CoA hydratase/isomerase family protein [Myxococcota bacterium]
MAPPRAPPGRYPAGRPRRHLGGRSGRPPRSDRLTRQSISRPPPDPRAPPRRHPLLAAHPRPRPRGRAPPRPLNGIGTTTLSELEALADVVRAGAGGARALLWQSARPGFCAGADLREALRRPPRPPRPLRAADRLGPLAARAARRLGRHLVRRQVRAFLDRIHAVYDTFDQAPLVTIAAVHGVAFGGGFELALTADQIVADRTARFAFPELRLGLVPGFGGVPRLQREVGSAVVRDLLLSGRSLGAARAHELGLVAQLVPKGEALPAARRLAAQAARFARPATAAAKQLAKPLPRAALDAEKAAFCALVTRPEVLDALRRFVEDEGVRPYLPAEGALHA